MVGKGRRDMRNPCVLCNIHGNSPSGLRARPRARACIFKTLGLMLYLLLRCKCLVNYIVRPPFKSDIHVLQDMYTKQNYVL